MAKLRDRIANLRAKKKAGTLGPKGKKKLDTLVGEFRDQKAANKNKTNGGNATAKSNDQGGGKPLKDKIADLREKQRDGTLGPKGKGKLDKLVTDFRAQKDANKNKPGGDGDPKKDKPATGTTTSDDGGDGKFSMTPDEKARFKKIRKNKGAAAAKKFRDGLRESKGFPPSPPDAGRGDPPLGGGGNDGGGNDGPQKKPFDKVKSEVGKGKKLGGVLTAGVGPVDPVTGVAGGIEGEFLGRITDKFAGQGQAVLDNAATLQGTAGERSPEFTKALALQEAGLGGFSTTEEEAARERALESINAEFTTGLRSAAALNLGRNLRGGVAAQNFAPVLQTAISQRRGIENDIFLANVAERARRLTEFTGTTERESDRAFGQKVKANTAQAGVVQNARDAATDIQGLNIDLGGREIGARIAANATGLGLLQDEKAERQRIKETEEALAANQDTIAGILSSLG